MEQVKKFENAVSEFFGSPYAVATDSCTHAIELCLRLIKPTQITVPTHTYLSVPMTAMKLGIDWQWNESPWNDFYYLTPNIIDAAVFWKSNSYLPGTFMCLSFQFRKHLSLGRGGMILTDCVDSAIMLKKMSYDGRSPELPWAEQNIDMLGFHYYMTPETAQLGLDKFPEAVNSKPKLWTDKDYPDLRKMSVFDVKQK